MRSVLLVTVVTLLLLSVGATFAQEDETSDDTGLIPIVLGCEEGSGCMQWNTAGQLTTENMGNLIGENTTGNNVIICTEEDFCDWTSLTPTEASIAYGGGDDFEVVDPNEPAEEEPDFDFTEEDFETEDAENEADTVDFEDVLAYPAGTRVVPAAGLWEADNLAGEMVCPMMTIEIPQEPVSLGQISVSADGDTYTGTGLAEDEGTVVLTRMHPDDNLFTGELEFEDPESGGTLLMKYELYFVTPWMGVGATTGTLSGMGMECETFRPFLVAHADLDFFAPIQPLTEEELEELAAEDEEAEDSGE